MTKANLFRLVLVLCLAAGLLALEAHADGCTQCVQTDAGYHGCAVDFGNAAACFASEDGGACTQVGNARDGCVGGFII